MGVSLLLGIVMTKIGGLNWTTNSIYLFIFLCFKLS